MDNEENNMQTSNVPNSNMGSDQFGNNITPLQPNNMPNEDEEKNKVVLIIGAVILLIVILGAVAFSLFGNSEDKTDEPSSQYSDGDAKVTAQMFIDAYKNYDANGIVKLLPEDYINTAKNNSIDLTTSIQKLLDEVKNMDYKITKMELLNATIYYSAELEGVREELAESCITYGMDKSKITAIVLFEIGIETIDEGITDYDKEELLVIKYKDKWNIFMDFFDVLDVENSSLSTANANEFIYYIEKVVKDTQICYESDVKTYIPGPGVYIYDIMTDLGYTSTSGNEGYVVVDARDIDAPKYIVYLSNSKYMILGYDVTTSGDYPTTNNLEPYDSTKANEVMGNALKVCNDWNQDNGQCMNRRNYVLSS